MIKKLHLGCGQTYLKGYLNIDYPITEHTVQRDSVADIFADISLLRYKKDEISEIRLHHVYEHFRRPQATAMLASWNSWMPEGGIVHIEVPDLAAMSQILSNPFISLNQKCVAERHLFGSHEAAWAAHYEGYDSEIFELLFSFFGFNLIKIKKSTWKGIHNLHVIARKTGAELTRSTACKNARDYLSFFCVDEAQVEIDMLEVWMDEFKKQLNLGWAEC